MTQDSSWTSRSANNQGFTGTNSNPNWSSFMNNNNIGGSDSGSATPTRTYSWSITFNNYGKQIFDTAVDDTGSVSISGYGSQFSMGGFNAKSSRTTSDYIPPGTYTISASSSNSGSGPWGIALDWTGYTPPPAALISSFSANPNPQTSGFDGIPNYNTTISWSTSNAATLTLTSSAGESWNVTGSTSRNITNLPQSSGNGASRSYTLTASNIAGSSVSDTIDVDVFNDRTPSNSWTTSFTGLDPNTEYVRLLGTFAGIDMVTKVSTGTSGVFFSTSVNGSYANPQYFTNGQNVYVKAISNNFNTSISGVSATATTGKVSNKTFAVTIGGLSAFNVTYQTKAPVIKEDFNFDGLDGEYPEPDVDFIENNPSINLQTNIENMNDIEIDMEVKSDNPDVQIKINSIGWQYVREI